MRKLGFSKDKGSLFHQELLERIDTYFEQHRLDRSGNARFKLKMCLYFGLNILFYALMITSGSLAAFYVFYLLLGMSVLLNAFNISHDAAHGVAVKSRFWNKVLFKLSFNLQGNNAYVWGKHHNESHHLYTNIEGSDIDVLNNPLFRMTTTQKRKSFHRYQWLYAPFMYLLYSINWFFFRETMMLFRYSSRTIRVTIPPREAALLILNKLLYVGWMIVIPALVLPFGWTAVCIAFLLNHFLISLIFVGVLGVSHVSDYVEHPLPDANGKLPVSWPALQMCTSVDYHPGSRLLNWTLGGFNAHALHHLLPNVCHIHYPDILPIFREVAAKYGVTYMEMSYGESLRSHFRFLKKMGRYDHPEKMQYARQAH